MKNKSKKLNESVEKFPFNKYVDAEGCLFKLVFDLNYFIKHATQIVNDFNHYGSCVLQDQDRAVYGLMFKDTSGDDNDIYMKAHVYRWPQYGWIHGGVTFWPGSKNFGEELKNAIQKVK